MAIVNRMSMAVVGFALLSSLGSLAFAAAPNTGSLGDPNVFERTIIIRPQTKAINVVQDETVRLVNQQTGKSFVWKFNTGGFVNFNLNSVAPPGALDQQVTAYVSERTRSDY